MTGKKTKVAGDARRVFAENVRRLMEVNYRDAPNKPKSLAASAGVTLSTIQRALSTEYAPTLDTVEAIAGAFSLQPYQILVEGLKVGKPTTVRPSSRKQAA